MSDLNQTQVVAEVRAPRGAVKIAGTIVNSWLSWEVENNNFRAADTFHVALDAWHMPAARDINWLSVQGSIEIEIFGDPNPTDPTNYTPIDGDRRIWGQVDAVDFNPVSGLIELTGRDFTARLIDTKTSEHHANQTASQIATELAGRHSLTPVVTPTTRLVGAYYTQDHVDINQQQSEWELLIQLADFEDYDVFVINKELHFQPKAKVSDAHYVLQWTQPSTEQPFYSSNTITMDFSRNLTIAKGVTVEVHSWNAKTGNATVASWPKAVKGTKPGQSASLSQQVYKRYIGGLTPDQAVLRAQKIYNEIVQHMVKLSATLPADDLLDCTIPVEVRGTGSNFDQVYYPEAITRTMSDDEGYMMTVRAKNISQEYEDTLG